MVELSEVFIGCQHLSAVRWSLTVPKQELCYTIPIRAVKEAWFRNFLFGATERNSMHNHGQAPCSNGFVSVQGNLIVSYLCQNYQT